MPGPLFWLLFPAHIVVLAVLLAKACLRGEGAFVARGIRDAVGGMSSVWAKRKFIQAWRKASVTVIAAALAWNIGAYLGKNSFTGMLRNSNDLGSCFPQYPCWLSPATRQFYLALWTGILCSQNR
jgi:hypothetical protein